MRLLTRIYAIALLGLLALLAALLLLTQQAQQTRQAELQALRDGHLLRNLRTAAENYLATGLQLEQLEILQQVIAREQAAFAGVVAIDVFAAGGTVLYSTDVGNRGTQVPEVEASLKITGKRPVELLMDTIPLDKRWCLIHATHLSDAERLATFAEAGVSGSA